MGIVSVFDVPQAGQVIVDSVIMPIRRSSSHRHAVVCDNSAEVSLRGLAVVELQHAAEPLTAAYWARSE